MGRFTGLAARCFIQRGADFPPDGCADDRTDCRRGGLAATLPKLVADDCAGCSTNESPRGFVLAHPTATGEKHCQGEPRTHTDRATANRVCCFEHDVFPLIDELARVRRVSRDGPPGQTPAPELLYTMKAAFCKEPQPSTPSVMPILGSTQKCGIQAAMATSTGAGFTGSMHAQELRWFTRPHKPAPHTLCHSPATAAARGALGCGLQWRQPLS